MNWLLWLAVALLLLWIVAEVIGWVAGALLNLLWILALVLLVVWLVQKIRTRG